MICRCMKDECAECMERYRLAALDLERSMRPGGRMRQKLRQIREAVDRLRRAQNKRGSA